MLTNAAFAVIAGLAPALAGCVSGPRYAEVANRIPPLAAGQSRIWFYRDSLLFGSGIQPSVLLDGEKVGDSVPGGFFYRDVPPGDHVVLLSTEVERKLSFTTAAEQERYVKMTVTLGVIIYRVYPELVQPEVGRGEIQSLSFTGHL